MGGLFRVAGSAKQSNPLHSSLAASSPHEPTDRAKRALLHAVTEAHQALAALNEKNRATGGEPLNFGIGVHVGDVMYGNIGSRARLDFTIIGPAVNMSSRLEALAKQLGRTVLLSRAFADLVAGDFALERVGECPVRGLSEPIELVCVSGVRAGGVERRVDWSG